MIRIGTQEVTNLPGVLKVMLGSVQVWPAVTGSDGMKVDSTWTAKTFTTPTTMMIGTTSVGATSAKLTGALYGDIEIVGRELIIPVERISDGKIGYWMREAKAFRENLGTGTPVSLGYA